MHDRLFRFSIPPSLLAFYFVCGAALRDSAQGVNGLGETFPAKVIQAAGALLGKGGNAAQVVSAVFAGGALLLSLGILVSTLTLAISRIVFWAVNSSYELDVFDEKGSRRFLRELSLDEENIAQLGGVKWGVVISHIFVHGVCNDGLRSFIDRRWNTFVVSSNCAMAGVLAILATWCSEVHPPLHWCAFVISLSLIFLCLGIVARADIVRVCNVALRSNHKSL